jgi:hypothetical protein
MLEKTSPIRTLRKNAVIKRSSVDFRLYQPAAKENQAPFSGLFLDRLKRLRVRTSQSNKELRTGRSINKEKVLGRKSQVWPWVSFTPARNSVLSNLFY